MSKVNEEIIKESSDIIKLRDLGEIKKYIYHGFFVDPGAPTLQTLGYSVSFQFIITEFKYDGVLRYARASTSYKDVGGPDAEELISITEWVILINDSVIVSTGVDTLHRTFMPGGAYKPSSFFYFPFSKKDVLRFKADFTLNENMVAGDSLRFTINIHYGLNFY